MLDFGQETEPFGRLRKVEKGWERRRWRGSRHYMRSIRYASSIVAELRSMPCGRSIVLSTFKSTFNRLRRKFYKLYSKLNKKRCDGLYPYAVSSFKFLVLLHRFRRFSDDMIRFMEKCRKRVFTIIPKILSLYLWIKNAACSNHQKNNLCRW